jgi:hypothetical protein
MREMAQEEYDKQLVDGQVRILSLFNVFA